MNWRNYLPLIGFFCFLWILSKISWVEFSKVVSSFHGMDMILVGSFAILGMCIKVFRWLLCFPKPTITRLDLVFMYLSSVYYGMVTPGRLGELLKVDFLTQRKTPLKEAWALTIYDRCFDVIFLLFGFAVLIFTLFDNFLSWLFLLACVISLPLFFFLSRRFFAFSFGIFFLQFLITGLSYSVFSLGFCFLLQVSVSEFPKAMLSVFAGNLISLIPVAFHGIGTREQIYLLALPAIPAERILAASLGSFFLSFFATLFFCFLFTKKFSKATFSYQEAGGPAVAGHWPEQAGQSPPE